MSQVLLYDADCGFCTRSAGWLARRGCTLEMVPFQQWDGLAAAGISLESAAAALHVVDGDEVLVGHLAIARALQRCSSAGLRAAGSVVRRLGPVSARAYALVAEHRHQLPGGTAACALPAASEEEPR